MSLIIHHVAPRFSAGSPAQVSEEEARRTAQHEKDLAPANANLQGIVYSTFEMGSFIQVRDLLTEEWFSVPRFVWRNYYWNKLTNDSRNHYRTHTP